MGQLDDALGDFFKGVGIIAVIALITQASKQPTPTPQRQHTPADPRDMGILLYLQGRYAEALPCLEHAICLRPHDALTRLCMGYDLLALGRYREALGSFGRAVSLDASLYRSVPTMARLAHRLGRFANRRVLAALWRIVARIGTHRRYHALTSS